MDRDFTRTAKALERYDAADDAIELVPSTATDDEVFAVLDARDAALKAVEEAFAADTIAINPNGVGPFLHSSLLLRHARACVMQFKARRLAER